MFDSIVTLFVDLGTGLSSIIRNPYALYGIYLIAFFTGIFALFKFIFSKVFKDNLKAANALSFMVTVITTGAVFYGTKQSARSTTDLLMLFNGFGAFVGIFLLSIGIGLISYNFYSSHKQSSANFAKFVLMLGVFAITSMLLPFFIAGGFIVSMSKSFTVFETILSLTNALSQLGLLWYTGKMIWGVFAFNSVSKIAYNRASREVQETLSLRALIKDLEENLKRGNRVLQDIVKSVGNPDVVKLKLNSLKEIVTNIKTLVGKIEGIESDLVANTLSSLFRRSSNIRDRKNVEFIKQNRVLYEQKCDDLITQIGGLMVDVNTISDRSQVANVMRVWSDLVQNMQNMDKMSKEFVDDVINQEVRYNDFIRSMEKLNLNGKKYFNDMVESYVKKFKEDGSANNLRIIEAYYNMFLVISKGVVSKVVKKDNFDALFNAYKASIDAQLKNGVKVEDIDYQGLFNGSLTLATPRTGPTVTSGAPASRGPSTTP